MTRLITLLGFLCLWNPTYAGHLLGGELTYQCMGNDDYQFTMKVYRDCNANAQFDAFAPVTFFDQSGVEIVTVDFSNPTVSTLPVNTNPCQTAPSTVCTEEAIYKTTVNLPPIGGGYTAVYQRCCRSPGIININAPGATGSTYTVHVPDPNLATCNSSPVFNQKAPLIGCMGSDINFDNSASDPDGDSLVYSLCTPFQGGSQQTPSPNPADPPPFAPVVWAGGFSGNNPITATPGFAIHPQTGLLTGVPTLLGRYAIGVCVEEWRNGMLINTVRRDFQLEIVPCQTSVVASIADHIDTCSDLTVTFQNLSTVATSFWWDFGDPFAINDTSNATNPTHTYNDTGEYVITLIANPGLPCSDTLLDTINVYYTPVVSFTKPLTQCLTGNSYDFQAIGNFSPSATYTWTFGSGTPATSNAPDPTDVVFQGFGSHIVTLEVSDFGCQDGHQDTVALIANPVAGFFHPGDLACAPYTVQFQNTSFAQTPMQYIWDFGDGNFSSDQHPRHTYPDIGDYDVTLTVITDSGCIDTVQITQPDLIQVQPRPQSFFTVSPDSASVFEPTFTFNSQSFNVADCMLYFDDGFFSENCNTIHEYSDTGNFRPFQVVWNDQGCTDTSWLDIRVIPEFLLYIPNAFTPDGDGLNDTYFPKVQAANEYEFFIFNRWGNLIYNTDVPNVGWDGNFRSGKEAPNGVYVYRINIRSHIGQEFRYFGEFTLVR